MKKAYIIYFLFFWSLSFSQGNCLLYPEGSNARKACRLAETTNELKQGSRESQQRFDSIIALNPKYAWAHFEKSVAFLKRGLILDGLTSLDKAVELDPLSHLCYRAYWFWQYRNYKVCIKDLETYYALPKAYIQFTPGGEKDMRIILGLAYAKRGEYIKGINAINDCIDSYETEDDFGFADYHTLGMLYVFNKQYDNAIDILNMQLTINENLPDTYYYLGLAYKGKSNSIEAKNQFQKALEKFHNTNKFYNINGGFPVSLSDIENEINF
jgi:tetratricopeptide (TPR) repeat protein